MQDGLIPAFERFLLQDVILTLGNLRQSLAWLGDESKMTTEMTRAGMQRIDRQIAMLEERARAVCKAFEEHMPDPADDLPLDALVLGAAVRVANPTPVLFRTRRAAAG